MTPKEECEELMNTVLPALIQLLEKNGEFFPVGAVMHDNREIAFTAFYDGNEKPESQEVIDNLVMTHKSSADSGEIVASCIAFDTRVTTDVYSGDAINFSLEHRDGFSAEVVFPYELKKKLFKNTISLSTPMAFENSRKIFL